MIDPNKNSAIAAAVLDWTNSTSEQTRNTNGAPNGMARVRPSQGQAGPGGAGRPPYRRSRAARLPQADQHEPVYCATHRGHSVFAKVSAERTEQPLGVWSSFFDDPRPVAVQEEQRQQRKHQDRQPVRRPPASWHGDYDNNPLPLDGKAGTKSVGR
jgi:hypothetical protein